MTTSDFTVVKDQELGLYDLALGLYLEDIGEDIQSYLTTANHPFI